MASSLGLSSGKQDNARIAVLMPAFMGGGAEAVCCWILQALHGYSVTLFTLTPPDFGKLNYFYGTSLDESEIKIDCPLPRFVSSRLPKVFGNFDPLHPWRQHFLAHWFRRSSARFDLAIGSYNEIDLGGPGIQYVHCPKFVLGTPRLQRWFGYMPSRMKANKTLACSQFVADLYESAHGAPAVVVHPPTPGDIEQRAWLEKESLFLSLGRIVPEKKVAEAISVIEKVRERGHRVRLEIWGAAPNKKYLRMLRKLESRGDWLRIVPDAGRREYVEALSRARFVLHLHEESYGIVVAEALRAGAIPFVPDRGGQLEIVGDCAPVLFRDTSDAVEKVDSLLRDEAQLEKTRRYLASRISSAGAEPFVEAVRSHVERALAPPMRSSP